MGLKMPFGDGLKDAIWNETESCREWAYRCHLETLNCMSLVSGRVSERYPCFVTSLNWGSEQAID